VSAPEEIFAAKQEVARECIQIIRKRKPLSALEKSLLECLCSQIGVKYLLVPPVNLFAVEVREDEESGRWRNQWF